MPILDPVLPLEYVTEQFSNIVHGISPLKSKIMLKTNNVNALMYDLNNAIISNNFYMIASNDKWNSIVASKREIYNKALNELNDMVDAYRAGINSGGVGVVAPAIAVPLQTGN